MDLILYILSGATVGLAIGLTGVGGGSLMTPLLLLFGYPVPVAIGTDLLYAAITKSSGVYWHQKNNNINWRIVSLLALGSIPVSLLVNIFFLDKNIASNENYESLLTSLLGFMLITTSLVIAFKNTIQDRSTTSLTFSTKKQAIVTVVVGILLGLCVTLSSVGAGAFGAAVLFILYPKLKTIGVIGSDLAHAVPLTLVAGLGYLYNGYVDFYLLGSLLLGSLPGIYLGTRLAIHLPEKIMRVVLVIALFSLGVKFTLFN